MWAGRYWVLGRRREPDEMIGAVDKEQAVLLPPRRFTWPEFDRWQAQHIGPGDVIVIEASGNAWHVHDQLTAQGATVHVANPLLVKWIGSAPVKTDSQDTLKLAKLLAAGLLPTVWVPPTPCARPADPDRSAPALDPPAHADP